MFHPEKPGIQNADYWAGHSAEDKLEDEHRLTEGKASLAFGLTLPAR